MILFRRMESLRPGDGKRWAGLLAMKTKEELINSSSRADTAILSIALRRLYGKRQLGQIRHPL
jgi:hypothetical protein